MFEKESAPNVVHDVRMVASMANLSNVDKMRIATGKKRVESWDKYRKNPASNPVDKEGNLVQVRLRGVVGKGVNPYADSGLKPEVKAERKERFAKAREVADTILPDRVESNAALNGKSLVKVSFGEREVLESGSPDLYNRGMDYDALPATWDKIKGELRPTLSPVKHVGLEAEGMVVGGKGRDQRVYVPAGNGSNLPTKNPKSPFKRERRIPVIVHK